MPLLMVRNDITKMQVDAIVNPANRELQQGRGTSRAIYLAAGEEALSKACSEIGFCEAGGAVLTKGFALPVKYVIHAVCPQWCGGKNGEQDMLGRTYRSALELAKSYRMESVAFPLLSSGFYGYPKEEAVHTAVTTISKFLLHEDMTVYLVLYDNESVEVSKKLVSSIEEYIDDHYVGEKNGQYDLYGDYRSNLPVNDADHSVLASSPPVASMPEPEPKPPASVPMPSAAAPGQRLPAVSTPALAPKSSAALPPSTSTAPADKVRSGKKPEKNFLTNLLKQLSPAKGRRLEDLMEHMDETFSEMLLRLIDERGLKDSAVYRKANIDRRLFSKIRNDVNYTPTKKTVVAFAIALELSLDETKDLLMKAGFALSNSSKFDVIISFFIENKQYDVFTMNEVLFAYGQPILGE